MAKATQSPKGLEVLTLAEEIAKSLFSKLGVKANIVASEEDDNLLIRVEGEDLGILIGYHGETLQSLQLVLSLMVNKAVKANEDSSASDDTRWKRVLLDIGHWRDSREEALRQLALRSVEKARFSKEPVSLPPMSASERRIIHLALQDNPEVTSESEGEGRNRRVVIRVKRG
jgi:spoIIIJ-associated protein